MQLGCRVMENQKFIENKGESYDFSQIKRMKSCAICDGMAQLKMKWRNLRGATGIGDMHWIFYLGRNSSPILSSPTETSFGHFF
jgi:hypothetical protein